jgi:ABC-type phosphate/phosphonate transport system substrate-binding protein
MPRLQVQAPVLVAAAAVVVAMTTPMEGGAAKPGGVRIGMIQTLFRGSDSGSMLAQTQPFGQLLHSQTGVHGDFCVIPDPLEMAKKIQEGTIELGILHGIEYAWVKQQYPELRPLVLAYNQTIKLKGYILVRNDSSIQSIADLKGKTLALSKRSLNHCYLFLHKTIEEAGHDPAGFFAQSATPANIDAALDAVVDGEAAATIVDGVALETYRSRKPGRAAKLRVLKESCQFPTATIIYKPAPENAEVAKRFRTGLLSAHERILGRQMLTLWRLSNFGTVPQEYDRLVDDVLKVFPKPVSPADFFAEQPRSVVAGGN